MRILITNDDGIHAPGLAVLQRIAESLGSEVWVVAPETDQSGVSHSLSLNDPLRVRLVAERTYAVRGTPTDCVIMAIRHLMPEKPDLVLSGVNRGQNIAEDVTYSGTIAGAMEGTLLGVRSVALSQAYGAGGRKSIPWETAETHGAKLISQLLDVELPKGTLLNINFPNCEPTDVKGVRMAMQGRRDQDLLSILERKDGRENTYYWFGFERIEPHGQPGTDLHYLTQNYITVTPLKLDLTDEPSLTLLESKLGDVLDF